MAKTLKTCVKPLLIVIIAEVFKPIISLLIWQILKILEGGFVQNLLFRLTQNKQVQSFDLQFLQKSSNLSCKYGVRKEVNAHFFGQREREFCFRAAAIFQKHPTFANPFLTMVCLV